MDTEVEAESEDKQGLSTTTKAGSALTLLALFGVVFIITTRQPGLGGPVTILIFLALLFLGGIGLFLVVAQLIFSLFKVQRFSSLRLFYTSVLVSLGWVFVIGLQTLGQLQVVDIVLVIVFEVLLNFYLLRRF
jgi:hypothetical protein